MLENIFLTVNEWLVGGTVIAALGAFFWGMICVIFSPCNLASFPLIVAYVGGQEKMVQSRQASYYSLAFTFGLFITIALVGIVCALLGWMLGDIGNYWQILVGLVLVYLALGMLGVEKCSLSAGYLSRFNIKGLFGAFVFGLVFGAVSGSCTFGFMAPLLAVITIQKMLLHGITLILFFALGQSVPIFLAANCTAAVRKLLEKESFHTGSQWFRRVAGVLIGLLGLYFIANPFLSR
ncbi:MAG: cytochrome C biosynthesis protein [Deltaproteobacteria bacterium]|nr:cytochrome C biosynthesis protein [Deltaproteobacteria bacterium]